MKSYCVCLLLATSTFSGCTKGKADSAIDPPDQIDPQTIQVLEKLTNKPIAGATVYIEKCANYDIVFGCTSYSTIKTLTTNSSGQVTFSPPSNFAAIQVQHQSYYSIRTESIGNIELTPKCIIKATIKRIKAYSPGDVLQIVLRDPDCPSYLCWSRDYSMGLPNDSIAYFEGQGYTNNQVFWYINFLSTD